MSGVKVYQLLEVYAFAKTLPSVSSHIRPSWKDGALLIGVQVWAFIVPSPTSRTTQNRESARNTFMFILSELRTFGSCSLHVAGPEWWGYRAQDSTQQRTQAHRAAKPMSFPAETSGILRLTPFITWSRKECLDNHVI